MRWKIVAFLGCLAPAGGCHVYHNAARNILNEPAQYLDDRHLEKQIRKDARHAWAEVCRQYPKRSFCDDFVDGFCDGYSDYLDNGGTAQVPAVPPLKYRRSKFLNPEGHERIRQYFLGFKYGMDVAISTGCRTFLTFPVVMPETPPPADPNITILPSPPDTTPALPAPRPFMGPVVETPDKEKPTDKDKPLADKDKPAPDKDKEKAPVDPVTIPMPGAEPKKDQWPTTDTAAPSRPAGPAGTIAVPPGIFPPGPETTRTRPLFPISAPSAGESGVPIKPMAGSTPPNPIGPTAGPLLDLPPARPPLVDLPDHR